MALNIPLNSVVRQDNFGHVCPHCRAAYHSDEAPYRPLGIDKHGALAAIVLHCPACDQLIVFIARGEPIYGADAKTFVEFKAGTFEIVERAVPRTGARPQPPSLVAAAIARDYAEACIVLEASAKASAALSRRCLQHLLSEAAKTKGRDLADQIQEVLDARSLPSHLADSLDAVRVIGNFAAHPSKSKATGEIVDVEPGEAEWTLDTLDGLFDFYYVQPQRMQERRAALNKKLADAGKPPLKD